MARRRSDTRTDYDSENHFNSVFDRGPLNDRFDEKRKSLFGSGYLDSCNTMSRASSTESLLEDLSQRATTLFHSLDPMQRGFINKEDLFSLNCDLNEEDLMDVFSQLDQDKDGCINVDDFKAGLKLINKQIHKKNLEKRRSRVSSITGWSPPQEYEKSSNFSNSKNKTCFNIRSSDEGMSLFSCEERICDFYEEVSAVNPDFAEQFNSIIQIILNDIKELSKEKQGLVARFHREKLMYENSLRHLEEEYESQIEHICKKESRSEAEKIEKDYRLLLQKKDDEIKKWKERLKDAEEAFQKMSSTAENVQLNTDKRDEMVLLQRETNHFQVQLAASQTENTMIRSELVTMKQQFNDKLSRLQQECNNLRPYEKDWQNLMKQLQLLRDINRRLQDTNDSLRSAIECSPSTNEIMRRISSTSPPVSMNPDCNLVQCDPAYNKKQINQFGRDKLDSGATPDSLLDEHGDSGLSTLRDVTELESEMEPLNVFSEIYVQQNKSLLALQCSEKIKEHISQDCQTQSLDRTMVSRPNSLQTDQTTRTRQSSKETSVFHRCDYPDGLVTSAKIAALARERESVKRFQDHRHRDFDSSDSDSIKGNVYKKKISRTRPPAKEIQCMPDRMYKIAFAGDASVGKSTFMMQFCTNSFSSDCMATIGVDVRSKTIEVDGKNIGLQLWDTAGQEKFRALTSSYFRKADGVLLLYDCTYIDSFIHVRDWVETIRNASKDEIPIVLVSNKSDLRDRYVEEGRKIVSQELGVNLANDYKLLFMETSAKSGENILHTMEELARVLTSNEDLQISNTVIDLGKNQATLPVNKASSSCCK